MRLTGSSTSQARGRVDDLRFGDMPEPAVQDDDVWL
jgi:hypothetical protein